MNGDFSLIRFVQGSWQEKAWGDFEWCYEMSEFYAQWKIVRNADGIVIAQSKMQPEPEDAPESIEYPEMKPNTMFELCWHDSKFPFPKVVAMSLDFKSIHNMYKFWVQKGDYMEIKRGGRTLVYPKLKYELKPKPLPAMAAKFAGSYGKHRIGLGKVS